MRNLAGLWLVSMAALLLLAVPAVAQEFVDVSEAAGVADDGLGKGVAFADVNGDGFVDLYVSNKGGANKLYLNDGDGSFSVNPPALRGSWGPDHQHASGTFELLLDHRAKAVSGTNFRVPPNAEAAILQQLRNNMD